MSAETDFVILAAQALVKRLDERAAMMAAADEGDKVAIRAVWKMVEQSEGKSWTTVPELTTLREALSALSAQSS